MNNSTKNKKHIDKILHSVNQEFHIKKTIFLLSALTILIIFMSFLIYGKFKKKIKIDNVSNIYKSKLLNMQSVAENINIMFLLNNVNKFVVKCLYAKNKDEDTILNECQIHTPYIRNKIYKGPTEEIYLKNSNYFEIKKYTRLVSNNNYITTEDVSGSFSDTITSNKPFIFYDEDLYLSGNNFVAQPQNNYLKITQKPNLIIDNDYKKHINDKYYSYKNSTDFYDLKAKIFEVFGDEGVFLANKNVILIRKNDIIKSQHLKATIDRNTKKINYIFLNKDVVIQNKDSEITADYGLFQANKNMVVFYKNVVAKTKTQKTNGDFYIYNTQNENGSTFNQYTILSKQEQSEFYNLLEYLKEHLSNDEKEYIDFVIKSNKEYIKQYNENKNNNSTERISLDRSKKVRAKISND